MENTILFSERQKFKQWWLWIILLGVNLLFLYGVFIQVIGGQPFGDKPISNIGLLITSGFVLALTLLFMSSRLDTIIKSDGVYVRFFPFHIKYKYHSWEMITKSYVRKYSAFTEYGGWGLRIGLFGKGQAYNVSGNQGLQLEFTDHKKLLIGTSKPGELIETLN